MAAYWTSDRREVTATFLPGEPHETELARLSTVKMAAVCLSKTSLFTAFTESYGVAPELQNCRDLVA
jgi:hypothetical protein